MFVPSKSPNFALVRKRANKMVDREFIDLSVAQFNPISSF